MSKQKFSPELAYLLGLMTENKSNEGVGVKGDYEIIEIFVKTVINLQIIECEKIIIKNNEAYFFHHKWERFFKKIESDLEERFKYHNEYSANYFAGIFDAVGTIDSKGEVYFKKLNKINELLLSRLGFRLKRKKEKVQILNPLMFLLFIKNYTKRFYSHIAIKSLRKENEV